MANDRFAAIEAGGTKILCALADRDRGVLAHARFATGDPESAFAAIAGFFDAQAARHGPVAAGGIASFGPLDLDRRSPGYGSLTTTPKPGWPSVNVLRRVTALLGAPVAIDTDVNCAGLAEARYGAGALLDRFCYVTVGTGIGVGLIEHGRPVAGGGHPEAGHSRVPRARGDEAFGGICPYHGDCLEGLACGPAMHRRWDSSAEHLAEDHSAWAFEAHYLACLCVNLMYTVRPQRIILGGGVMERRSLYDRVRAHFAELTAGYALDRWSADPARFIAAPELREPSPGLIGAIELARDAAGRAPDGHRDRGAAAGPPPRCGS